MTAPAKAPARRLLATYATEVEALARADYWTRMEGKGADVQVEPVCNPTTPDQPWGVTAAKTTGGGA
jgi:hypothetical protein